MKNKYALEESTVLTVRAFNCLKRAGINDLREVAPMSDERLLGIRRLTENELPIIRRAVIAAGLVPGYDYGYIPVKTDTPPRPDLLVVEDPEPNAETIAAIEAAERGEGLLGPFETVEELMAALNADDDGEEEPEPVFRSSYSMQEIEENFKDVDVFSGIMEGLEEALAHAKGHRAAKEAPVDKSIEYYMSLPYRIEIVPDRVEGGYALRCPELPGCITQGETIEEGLVMLEDAKRCWLESCLAHGDPIPEPSSTDE